MATVVPASEDHFHLNAAEHPIFWNAFDTRTRNSLMVEDLTAGRSISLILGAIVTLGLLLGIFTLTVVLS